MLPSGERSSVGSGEPHVTARIHDKKALFELVRGPRLAFGELYMDGRITIEQGELIDLLSMVVGANRFEDGGPKGRLKEQFGFLKSLLPRRNDAAASRRNVAHHYDLDERL